MAEIPVQRKQRRSIWPLLLLLIIALAAAWYFWSRQQGSVGAPRADSTSTTTTSMLPNRVGTSGAPTRGLPSYVIAERAMLGTVGS